MGPSRRARSTYIGLATLQLAAVLHGTPWFTPSAQVPLAIWLAIVLVIGWRRRVAAGALALLTAAVLALAAIDDMPHCPCGDIPPFSAGYRLLWLGHAITLLALAWSATVARRRAQLEPHPPPQARAAPRGRVRGSRPQNAPRPPGPT